jgi:hypothetical protein
MPLLKATRSFEAKDVEFPLSCTAPPDQKKGKRRKLRKPPEPDPVQEVVNPMVAGEAWYAQLHRLELLTEKEHFWGCHLLLLCEEAWDPSRGNVETMSWLAGHLRRQLSHAVEAVQQAAADLAAGGTGAGSGEDQSGSGNEHSEDFRTILWFGKQYSFTPKQAACMRSLWRAWEKGWKGVSQQDLLSACQSDGSELRGIFKNSPAWKTIIVSVQKGVYALQPPRQQ